MRRGAQQAVAGVVDSVWPDVDNDGKVAVRLEWRLIEKDAPDAAEAERAERVVVSIRAERCAGDGPAVGGSVELEAVRDGAIAA